MIEALARAGADVFRLNFSHGTHAEHAVRHAAIREVEQRLGRPIGILIDLQGPKLRVGTFATGKEVLEAGQRFCFDASASPGTAERVYLPHPEIFAALQPGHHLLVDDGRLRFKVLTVSNDCIATEVVVSGTISDRKGVSVPEASLSIPALSPKDRADLEFGLSLGVDWVALSFVQRAQDVIEAKTLIKDRAAVMAKIEKPQAVDNIASILEVVDALMVARGDLGVEMPPEDVPLVQKRLVRLSRDAGKPVVVATQMLESMTGTPTPTRAEASDVATAVYDGADAVMLSAESASGSYPVEAVAMMARIIRRTEADPLQRQLMNAVAAQHVANPTDAIGAAINTISDVLPLGAAITYTSSGATALRISRVRPRTPILSLTPNVGVARRLALVWGVRSRVSPDARQIEDIVSIASDAANAEGLCECGRPLVVAAGVPFGQPGSTNLLRIVWPSELTTDGAVSTPASSI
ncbi:pyruvate kinase [Paraburkholderia sp. BL25I1N1]|uniref:pyruvate kinase n=1 Tax=Paraburkholderia sp. BL25I1N1 TaxID=1938804 RepID=UPI0035BE53D0